MKASFRIEALYLCSEKTGSGGKDKAIAFNSENRLHVFLPSQTNLKRILFLFFKVRACIEWFKVPIDKIGIFEMPIFEMNSIFFLVSV